MHTCWSGCVDVACENIAGLAQRPAHVLASELVEKPVEVEGPAGNFDLGDRARVNREARRAVRGRINLSHCGYLARVVHRPADLLCRVSRLHSKPRSGVAVQRPRGRFANNVDWGGAR